METIIGFVGLNVSMFVLLFVAGKLKCPRRMLWLRGMGLVASAAFLIGLLIAPVSAAVITEYWYGPGPARPWEVACDVSANRAFYTAQMSNRIGLVEWGAGKFTEWDIPTSGSNPWGIALGPEISTDTGTFAWFTESVGGKIGRLNPITGEFVEWQTSTGSAPRDIAIDKTRLIVWFTEYLATGSPARYKIGKLQYVGGVGWRMTEYPIPSGQNPNHITVDSEGIVWFTARDAVIRFNPFKGEFTTYAAPPDPKGIALDKDGFIWYAASGIWSICRLNWWKNETLYWQIPTSGCDPSEILIDQDYNVWFTEFATGKIGKFVPGTGDFYEYPTPTPGSQPYGLCIQSSDTIVFTEAQANRLGRVFQPAWMAGGVDTITTTVNWVSHASTSTTTGATTSSTTTIASSAVGIATTFTTSTQTQWSTTSSTITETKSVLYTSSTTTSTQTSTTTTVSTTTTSTTTSRTSTTTETSTTTTTTSTTSTSTTTEISSSTMTVTYPTTTYYPTITSMSVSSWTTTSTSVSVTSTETTTTSMQTRVVTNVVTVTSTPTVRQCIIASAALGSELAPDVQFLRGFRDLSVQATFAGGAFMEVFNAFYYSFSTGVASYIVQYPALQETVKLLLYPLIASLRFASAVFSTLSFAPEIAVLSSGLLASTLIGAAYLAPLIVTGKICSRKLRRRN
jgi:streptogramin lyase